MAKILRYDFTGKPKDNKYEKYADIIILRDHKFLSNYAKTHGLNYREFRSMLNEYDVLVDTAVEILKKGIEPAEYVRKREEERAQIERWGKRVYYGTIGLAAASVIISIYTSLTTPIRPKNEKEIRALEEMIMMGPS